MKIPNPKFEHGAKVWLECGPEELPGRVVTITLTPGMCWMYNVTWGTGETTCHYAFELTEEKSYT